MSNIGLTDPDLEELGDRMEKDGTVPIESDEDLAHVSSVLLRYKGQGEGLDFEIQDSDDNYARARVYDTGGVIPGNSASGDPALDNDHRL